MEDPGSVAAGPVTSRTAFVTGGTGFVGSHVVEELLGRGYDRVRCLVRKDPKWLQELDVEYIYGDLDDEDRLCEALDGVDYVYHVAGLTRAQSPSEIDRANVDGTLCLMRAVRRASPDVRSVLVTSSLAVIGMSDEPVADEDTDMHPISDYGRSKARMERSLWRADGSGPAPGDVLPLVIVRPSAVYGPRDTDILTFFQSVARGVCPIVGRGLQPELSLIHVSDLARAMVDAAEARATAGKTYFLASERAYSWTEIRDATVRCLDRRVLTVHVPRGLVGVVGAVAEVFGRLTGSYPPLNREKAREIVHACKICDVSRATADFEFRTRIQLEEGIRSTLGWYRARGWLKG